MKKMELNQMEALNGACNGTDAQAQIAIMGLAGSMFGPVGAFVFTIYGIYATDGGKNCI